MCIYFRCPTFSRTAGRCVQSMSVLTLRPSPCPNLGPSCQSLVLDSLCICIRYPSFSRTAGRCVPSTSVLTPRPRPVSLWCWTVCVSASGALHFQERPVGVSRQHLPKSLGSVHVQTSVRPVRLQRWTVCVSVKYALHLQEYVSVSRS